MTKIESPRRSRGEIAAIRTLFGWPGKRTGRTPDIAPIRVIDANLSQCRLCLAERLCEDNRNQVDQGTQALSKSPGQSTPKYAERVLVMSRSLLRQRLLDVQHIVGAKPNVSGAGNTANLLSAADADDRAGDSRISQGPRDRDLARRRVVAAAYGAEPFDQPQITGKQRLLEIGTAFPPSSSGEPQSVAGIAHAQQSGRHGGIRR